MSSWAPNLAGIKDKGFGGSRNGDTVNGVVLHHTANGGGTSALEYVANSNSRNSHPTYLVQNNGAVWGIVHPNRRPYSTGGRPDSEAVTFEIDNSGGAPNWPVSDAALSTVARVIAHHYNESTRKGKGIARNKVGVAQQEFFVAWHSQYVATACPGPHVLSRIDAIIAAALSIANGVTIPKPEATTDADKARVRKIAKFLNAQGLADFKTAAESDGIPLDPGEIYSRYWHLVQLWGYREGLYEPSQGYKVDGIVGPKTREVEAILWARLNAPKPDPIPEVIPNPHPEPEPEITPEPEPEITPEPEPEIDPIIPDNDNESENDMPVYVPPTETPNIVIENPKARKIVRSIVDSIGALIVVVGGVDLASPDFDVANITVPALAGYTIIRTIFGFSVDNPNTPSAKGRHEA
jgi:hypothetical protein